MSSDSQAKSTGETPARLSAYISRDGHVALKRLAVDLTAQQGSTVKVHDLVIEGLELVAAKYGITTNFRVAGED